MSIIVENPIRSIRKMLPLIFDLDDLDVSHYLYTGTVTAWHSHDLTDNVSAKYRKMPQIKSEKAKKDKKYNCLVWWQLHNVASVASNNPVDTSNITFSNVWNTT